MHCFINYIKMYTLIFNTLNSIKNKNKKVAVKSFERKLPLLPSENTHT